MGNPLHTENQDDGYSSIYLLRRMRKDAASEGRDQQKFKYRTLEPTSNEQNTYKEKLNTTNTNEGLPASAEKIPEPTEGVPHSFRRGRPLTRNDQIDSPDKAKVANLNKTLDVSIRKDSEDINPETMDDQELCLLLAQKCSCGCCRWNMDNPPKHHPGWMKSVYEAEYSPKSPQLKTIPVINYENFQFTPNLQTVAYKSTAQVACLGSC
eukprot:TRINITY_DN11164_c0_g2_i2.p1 TRINITY_DN11164_c0_g2~~TRINITY_DN11164_c0_g2_i2.p1  ORF type:complete len:209 (-),score=32.81 TRINITY_DN11164_c0_g2_i2:574-1200(-)